MFSSTSSSNIFAGFYSGSQVNYRSTETLYFNEYWYEYESVSAGSTITFSISSTPAKVSFIIADQIFSSFPSVTKTGSITDQITLSNNDDFWYEMLYLEAGGSSISCTFNSSKPVDFFIADSTMFNNWYQGGTPSFYDELTNVTSGVSTYTILTTRDYYLVWYNPYPTIPTINYSISYVAANVYDFSGALIDNEAVYSSSSSVTVATAGTWYFYIYFDPMNSPEESTTITFDVTYTPASTSGSTPTTPANLYYVVPIIIIIIVFVIIIAVAVSRSRRKVSTQETMGVPPTGEIPLTSLSPTVTQAPVTPRIQTSQPEVALSRCYSCGAEMSPGALYCIRCGRKQQGRQVGTPDRTTPAKARNCSLCGSDLEPGTKFCAYCGTPVD
ncbi:MAG: hypothetical protein RBG13Loki_1100 [Promethearchaeota archaeon CR_4]|nr:MAG: hypothetical protein RBG13Loki_1100 [Candidatus Lokiarchaeota archaeon CR_4]